MSERGDNGYTVVGFKDDVARFSALRGFDSFFGATSVPLSEGLSDEFVVELGAAQDLHDAIQQMDQRYWPGFGPIVARVERGKVVELLMPPGSDPAEYEAPRKALQGEADA